MANAVITGCVSARKVYIRVCAIMALKEEDVNEVLPLNTVMKINLF